MLLQIKRGFVLLTKYLIFHIISRFLDHVIRKNVLEVLVVVLGGGMIDKL